MNSIFLGFLFDEEKEKEQIKRGSGVQNAANQYQRGFVSELRTDIMAISALCVGSFPRRNKSLFYGADAVKTDFGTIRYLPFINLYWIKDVCVRHSLKKEIKALLKKEESIKIYVYSLFMPFLRVIKALKNRYGGRLDVCLIIPDLPGKYGIMRKWYTLGGLRDRFEATRKMELASLADSYVFLTESMRELFPKRPYRVIEGFLPDVEYDRSTKRIPKTVLYTGSLNPNYGIIELLEQFSEIEGEDYRLWICGAGGVENTVRQYAERDSRIKYFGFLSRKEIAELQTKCDVLVNPRTAEGEYTKYSFPSKTMEYLLSGSKVVMHRLEGIPEEYYEHVYTIASDDNSALKQSLMDACGDTQFYTSRSAAQVNWITNRNSTRQ